MPQTLKEKVVQMRIRERAKGQTKLNSQKLLLSVARDKQFDNSIAKIRFKDDKHEKPEFISFFGDPDVLKNRIANRPERRLLLKKGVDIEVKEGFFKGE